LNFFTPEDLQLLICGSLDLNFEDLQKSTVYDNGFSEEHPVIKNFWEVVHSLSLEQKKDYYFLQQDQIEHQLEVFQILI